MPVSHTPEPAHIAFFSAPAHGHVNPMLGIITELVARGHRVSYATTRDFADRVAEAGASPVIYHSTLPSDSDPTTSWPDDLNEGLLLFIQESIATLPEIEAAFRHDRPDLVLSEDTVGAGRIMAAKWDILPGRGTRAGSASGPRGGHRHPPAGGGAVHRRRRGHARAAARDE